MRYFFNRQRITTITSFFTLQTQATGVGRTYHLRARKINCGHELTQRRSFLSRSIPKFTIVKAMNSLNKLLRVILGEFQKIPKLNREPFELCYTIEPAYNLHIDKRTENEESEYTKLFAFRNTSDRKSTISAGTGGVRGITTESSSDRDLKARTVHEKERSSDNAKLNANEGFKTDDFPQIIENTPDPKELFDHERRIDEVKKNSYVGRHKLISGVLEEKPEKKETQTCKLKLKKTSGTIYETDYEKQMRNARRMLSEWRKP